MAADVFASDEQGDPPVELDRWVVLARSVLEDRGVKGGAEVSLLFVDEATIARLNAEFLDRAGPTDVLAFPIEEDVAPGGRSPDLGGTGPGSELEEEPPALLGDVVVCPSVARRNADERGVSLDDELALLIVHGLLHLLGMDHAADAEAERMEALERALLTRYHAPTGADGGPADGGPADGGPADGGPADGGAPGGAGE